MFFSFFRARPLCLAPLLHPACPPSGRLSNLLRPPAGESRCLAAAAVAGDAFADPKSRCEDRPQSAFLLATAPPSAVFASAGNAVADPESAAAISAPPAPSSAAPARDGGVAASADEI
jgi:hypothetical protein